MLSIGKNVIILLAAQRGVEKSLRTSKNDMLKLFFRNTFQIID